MAIQAADIGIAQLAMHSSYETCAVSDLSDLYWLLSVFFVS
jgi:aspartyl aminopeptidase